MSDYAELDFFLEDGETTDLWVYTEPNKFFIVKDVNGYPVRYNGWWTIPLLQYNKYSMAHVEASKVMYFVTIHKDKVNDGY